MKNVKINWNTFYFKKFEPVMNWVTHLSDLYNNASVYKWQAFNYRNEKMYIYWMVGNSCKFTIYWQVKDENWIEHDVKITADNNWILN